MSLSYEEMHSIFENLGFKGFQMRKYDDEMFSFLSAYAEDNAKVYMVDVVPSSLDDGVNEGIALMEKHYYKSANMDKLCEKWFEIILLFLCYYPLESIFVTGSILPDDEDFVDKTPNQEGYYLEFPFESISDLDTFAELVSQKTYGRMTFWFASLDMVFRYEQSDVYMMVTLKKITEENTAAIDLLRKLVEAQGLFLL